MADERGSDTYTDKLYLSDFLREPVIRRAIEALQLPSGSQGLDAGCGIGSHALLLADAVSPAGHVTGLDISPDFLARAEETAGKSGLSERVSFQKGDVKELPFDDNSFDWIWSVDCVGYPAGESVSLLDELVRVTKPGGTVAILGWSSQQLLPGYALLEARLNAACSGIAPFVRGRRPELHFPRALGWFRGAGFEEPTVQTFVGDVHAPLTDEVRSALVSLFDMCWPGAQSDLTQEDWAAYQRLSQPESPDFILNLPDYYAFFTYSMFCGKKAK
ncbi:methyltransferase type 11 [candidate division TA06 bacterium SM1_40]|uniref:Methyltransferase type 11 n=2 Tax=Bacteria division TA06 TaxID=1156500 RepID=A0A0S8JAN8_UNCT6|nr:MAG: methyltransferase type 11 [candidate division TA06 bacterium SM23_40]KPL05916.1 MAG: methyltransferase type 11 [candidate division TA06 bacterium SM1_40]